MRQLDLNLDSFVENYYNFNHKDQSRLVGFVDRDKLHKAFKDSKLLMRDRVVWQGLLP